MKALKNIAWEKLTFSITPTDFMYLTHCQAGQNWPQGKLEAYGDIPMSPGAGVLNYGQGIFEGMKAYRSQDMQRAFLFRPEANADRMADGCRRLCMPVLPREIFLDAVTQVVQANQAYIPPYSPKSHSQAALYVRPLIFGSGAILGVSPAPRYTFVVYASPVGPYFKGGIHPIKLRVSEDYYRAMPGGSGSVKAIGNYCPGMLPAQNAKKEGFSEVLYLDVREQKYVEEVGAANFFCIKGDSLLTPELDGCILPGITRESILRIARERLGMKIVETRLPIGDAIRADEAFASGTAAVISPIGSISYRGQEYILNDGKVGPTTQRLYEILVGIQHGLDPDPYGWRNEIQLG